MAWQFFTDFLSPGDLITPDQISELWSAIEERTPVADSGFTPPLVSNKRPGWSQIHTEIVSVSENFFTLESSTALNYVTYLASSYETFRDILYVAAQSLGLSSSEISAIHPSAGSLEDSSLRSSDYWNICRQALILMDIVSAPLTKDRQSFQKVTDPIQPTWEDAKTDYLSDPESDSTTLTGNQTGSVASDSYKLDGRRSVITNINISSDYGTLSDAFLRIHNDILSGGGFTDTLRYGSSAFSLAPGDAEDFDVDPSGSVSAEWDCYADPDIVPDPTDNSPRQVRLRAFGGSGSGDSIFPDKIYGKPSFQFGPDP